MLISTSVAQIMMIRATGDESLQYCSTAATPSSGGLICPVVETSRPSRMRDAASLLLLLLLFMHVQSLSRFGILPTRFSRPPSGHLSEHEDFFLLELAICEAVIEDGLLQDEPVWMSE